MASFERYGAAIEVLEELCVRLNRAAISTSDYP